ncbi:MAG: NAD-dependent epimerase/dehydratase family protein [Actinobacteria bacterium]|nr:NAD-dependent epimerase/dehydratase family protein [Actinomycetota bacterium]
MTKVLLTGASGYIGKHIALQLLTDSYEVRASVRNSAKADEVSAAVAAHLPAGFDLKKKLSFVELDLEKDAGWAKALDGIDVLLHTASPFPIASPKDENDLVRPAVEGTLRALKAAHKAGVKRVILTSSVAAIYGSELPAGKTEFDESMWSDPSHPIGSLAYNKSKTLAEKAAWDYISSTAPEIELTTINPVLVAGAPLDKNFGASVSVVERLMNGKDPVLPDMSFGIVDVKDVAAMHVKAIKSKQAKGQRFIANAGSRTFIQMAKALKSEFPTRKIPTGKAPTMLIRLLALFDGEIKAVLPGLGKHINASSKKAQTVLGIEFIPVEQSLVETAHYLVDNKLVK